MLATIVGVAGMVDAGMVDAGIVDEAVVELDELLSVARGVLVAGPFGLAPGPPVAEPVTEFRPGMVGVVL